MIKLYVYFALGAIVLLWLATQTWLPQGLWWLLVAVAVALAGRKWWAFNKKSYNKVIKQMAKLRGKAAASHGTADFADLDDLAKLNLLGDKGCIIGRFHNRLLRFNQPGHLITFAPTRSGKGVGHVIPNLLDHPGSVVVNDIKGENYAITGRFRAQLGKVYTFAPFDPNSDCYNPLDFIRLGTVFENDDAQLIANMIILEDNKNDLFWSKEAKNLVTGLILFAATELPKPLRNLGEVRHLLMQDKKDFDKTINEMQNAKNEYVRRVGNSLQATESKVLMSVLSTAKSQTAVWDSPNLQRITARSDFKLEDIKREVTSLYIIIPPEYLTVYASLMRLMVGLAVKAMTRVQGAPKDPVLYLVDEFPALGYMEPIENGVGFLAGYGVKLWMFIQDLSQLKLHYEKSFDTFISNCYVRAAFGTSDVQTAETLSKMLGTTTIRVTSESTSDDPEKTGKNASTSETSRALLTADEVMRLPNDTQVLFVQGSKPILAEKIRYYADPEFTGKYDQWGG